MFSLRHFRCVLFAFVAQFQICFYILFLVLPVYIVAHDWVSVEVCLLSNLLDNAYFVECSSMRTLEPRSAMPYRWEQVELEVYCLFTFLQNSMLPLFATIEYELCECCFRGKLHMWWNVKPSIVQFQLRKRVGSYDAVALRSPSDMCHFLCLASPCLQYPLVLFWVQVRCYIVWWCLCMLDGSNQRKSTVFFLILDWCPSFDSNSDQERRQRASLLCESATINIWWSTLLSELSFKHMAPGTALIAAKSKLGR